MVSWHFKKEVEKIVAWYPENATWNSSIMLYRIYFSWLSLSKDTNFYILNFFRFIKWLHNFNYPDVKIWRGWPLISVEITEIQDMHLCTQKNMS